MFDNQNSYDIRREFYYAIYIYLKIVIEIMNNRDCAIDLRYSLIKNS